MRESRKRRKDDNITFITFTRKDHEDGEAAVLDEVTGISIVLVRGEDEDGISEDEYETEEEEAGVEGVEVNRDEEDGEYLPLAT